MQWYKDNWSKGDYTAAFRDEMVAKNLQGIGCCTILDMLIELKYEDLMTELDSGE